MKKIVWIYILAVIMLVAVSYVSAVTANSAESIQKKESPLYRVRSKIAISEKIATLINMVKSRFLGERIFFLRFDRLSYETPILSKEWHTNDGAWSCDSIICFSYFTTPCPTVHKSDPEC